MRFDLVCQGRQVTSGARGVVDKPVSTRATIDLATRRFCWRGPACSPLPIRAATASTLTLRDEHTVEGSLVYVVHLPAGAYDSSLRVRLTPPPDIVSHESGVCTRAPYTPF